MSHIYRIMMSNRDLLI